MYASVDHRAEGPPLICAVVLAPPLRPTATSCCHVEGDHHGERARLVVPALTLRDGANLDSTRRDGRVGEIPGEKALPCADPLEGDGERVTGLSRCRQRVSARAVGPV